MKQPNEVLEGWLVGQVGQVGQGGWLVGRSGRSGRRWLVGWVRALCWVTDDYRCQYIYRLIVS
jgi:hypothetical protein